MAAPLNPTSFDLRPLTPTRPHLRVIEGGRSPAAVARRRMYLRRRVVAALLAGIVGLVGVRLAGAGAAALAGDGATTLTAAASTDASATAAAATDGAATTAADAATPSSPPVYVVRRGDTLWSIAGALGAAADADPRELVDALSERTDGRALQPGQRIDLSGLPGVDG